MSEMRLLQQGLRHRTYRTCMAVHGACSLHRNVIISVGSMRRCFSERLAELGESMSTTEDDARIPTHVAGLDERLGGGVPKGHTVPAAGPPRGPQSTVAG